LEARLKRTAIEMCRRGTVNVVTDAVASPTGFPFKVLSIPGTLSDPDVYQERTRCCGLGYLRQAYKKPDGSLGWRCPAENVDAFIAKGGKQSDTIGRKCLCNALLANIGLEQRRTNDKDELPLVTCGDSIQHLVDFLPSPTTDSYSAGEVVRLLLSSPAQTCHYITETV
jgi:nitronate monooxygenase